MVWSKADQSMVGQMLPSGIQLGLSIPKQQLFLRPSNGKQRAEKILQGATLADLLEWTRTTLAERFGANDIVLSVRDYDMPEHPVGSAGAVFESASPEAATELGRYYDNADAVFSDFVPLRRPAPSTAIWPHHFDLGGIDILDTDQPLEKARQIGFGLSPGDSSYEEPYFYVTPWPIPAQATLPSLAGLGHWHKEGFTGAILLASNICSDGSGQQDQVVSFLRSAFAAGDELIPEREN